MNKKIYYFDNGATTQVDEKVVKAMHPYFDQFYGNPGSIHQYGRKSKAAIENARESFASFLEISPSSLFFTGSGSEANNMAILGICQVNNIKHIISSRTEHSSVVQTIDFLTKSGIEITMLNPGPDGEITTEMVEKVIRKDTGLVSIMAVNNETGVINDIGSISKILPGNAVFHVDLVQALVKIPISLNSWRIDLASFAAHKIHGPKGIGALYVKPGIKLGKIIHGGGQEMNRRPGTENTSGIVGFAEAVKVYPDVKHVLEIRDKFESVLKEKIPAIKINGGNTERAPHISNVMFPKIAGDSLLINLDINGIMASLGSACASGSINPSRVLLAMGLNRDEALSSIRFSFGSKNTLDEIEPATDIITETVNRLRR